MIGGTHGCPGLALLKRGLRHLGVQHAKAVVQIAQRRAALDCSRGGQGVQLRCHSRQSLGARRGLAGRGCVQRDGIKERLILGLDPDVGGFGGKDEGQGGLVGLHRYNAHHGGARFARYGGGIARFDRWRQRVQRKQGLDRGCLRGRRRVRPAAGLGQGHDLRDDCGRWQNDRL
jgi:hypothetical protein